jgi:formamidopyrimidine-DNA glycosylase
LPELPEVETLKNDLDKKIAGKRIIKTLIRSTRIIRRNPSREFLKRSLLKKKIMGLQRRGKALLFFLDSDEALVIRLGMTGQITLSHAPTQISDKYTYLILTLEGGLKLQFKDIRQFGQVFITPVKEVEEFLQMGPEPLQDDFHLSHLKQILNSPSHIKTLLMDQRKIAGIGNIYSDEILFAAGINPLRSARSITPGEMKRLYRAIRQVLTKGIKKRGTTIRDFRDGFGKPGSYQHDLRVYQRRGQACLICETPIERMKLRGRSFHFCPRCQN